MTDADRAEVQELRKRNRLLEEENEVLRRAAAYLSQANSRPDGLNRSAVLRELVRCAMTIARPYLR